MDIRNGYLLAVNSDDLQYITDSLNCQELLYKFKIFFCGLQAMILINRSDICEINFLDIDYKIVAPIYSFNWEEIIY